MNLATTLPASRSSVSSISLSDHVTMRIGGPATLVVVDRREDLVEICQQTVRWLGRGANLLVSDQGVAEPVVKLGPAFGGLVLTRVADHRGRVEAGAACDLARLIGTCIQAGFAGPEGLSGVPATVGGALRMNAGTRTCWILDLVERLEVLLPGEASPRWLDRSELSAAYRQSGLPPGAVVLGCVMELPLDDPALLRAKGSALKKAKAATQPLALPSAGCIFRNPRPDLPAGRLIDELGLKGERCGDAQISPVHGNFIVNTGSARADDVGTLIRRIRTRAWEERGITMELEVETWGTMTWDPLPSPGRKP